MDLGGRFVLQRCFLANPRGSLSLGPSRGRSGSSRWVAADATCRPGTTLTYLFPHPITAEASLDLSRGVVLRLGRIGRTRVDMHLVHYRFQTVYEGVQRGPLIVFQRDCFGVATDLLTDACARFRSRTTLNVLSNAWSAGCELTECSLGALASSWRARGRCCCSNGQ